MGLRGGRIELHPDGQLFFVQNLAGNEQIVSRLSPSSGFQSLRISASCSLSERGEPTAGARSSSSRFTGLAPGSGISGRVAKYSGNCCVTWR